MNNKQLIQKIRDEILIGPMGRWSFIKKTNEKTTNTFRYNKNNMFITHYNFPDPLFRFKLIISRETEIKTQ